MLRSLCKSKISNAFVTDKALNYSGSLGVDKAILEASDIMPGEQVQVLNLNNGERITTYVIEEKEGSGKIILYGPATRRGEIGDEMVILSYCLMETMECHNLKHRFVTLGKNNQLKSTGK